MNRSTTPSRILAAAGIALASLAVTGGPAAAVSSPIPYSCTFDVAGTEGSGDATATWDSAVPDAGISVPAWTPVPLDPYTGTVVLPDAFVDALRTEGVTDLGGGGTHQVHWDLPGTPESIELVVAATPVPATGPMTIEVAGVDAGTFSHSDAETYLLIADDFSLTADGGAISMSCTPTDVREGTRVIDSVTVTIAPTTTPATPTTTAPATASASATPSATESAVRPALVQTDQPQPGPSPLPLVALGLAAVALGGGLVAVRTGRARRH